MYSIRKWFYKPKKEDTSRLAMFYWADEELTMVATELDSFDGRIDPDRCSVLVTQLRLCQDKVLNICNEIMDEVIPDMRANRDFRAKFPDDVLQESLAGQLWFGAECLAAGSNIIHRELESASMRPLAKALIRSLDNVRCLLREQSLKNSQYYPDKLKEALRTFDRLFAEFELCSVSAMVTIKSAKEYHLQQEVIVLFSETLIRGLKMGLMDQEMVDDYDPSLMFTIPRLAIVWGLLIFTDGPLNVDRNTEDISELFRPFNVLLSKIRDLLWTLTPKELNTLEKMLCSKEEPKIDVVAKSDSQLSSSAPADYMSKLYDSHANCKQFVRDFYTYNFGALLDEAGTQGSAANNNNINNNINNNNNKDIVLADVSKRCGVASRLHKFRKKKSRPRPDPVIPAGLRTFGGSLSGLNNVETPRDYYICQNANNTCCNCTDAKCTDSQLSHSYDSRLRPEYSLCTCSDDSPLVLATTSQPDCGDSNCNSRSHCSSGGFCSSSLRHHERLRKLFSEGKPLSDLAPSSRRMASCDSSPETTRRTAHMGQSLRHPKPLDGGTRTDQVGKVPLKSMHRKQHRTAPQFDCDMCPNRLYNSINNSSPIRARFGSVRHQDNSSPLLILEAPSPRPEPKEMNCSATFSSCSSCQSISSMSSPEWNSTSPDTSSYNSECQDDEEIALALQAAEIASRNKARSRFKSSTDLLHKLFVCISGVADQLQTNFASDLRNILKSVFEMNSSESLESTEPTIDCLQSPDHELEQDSETVVNTESSVPANGCELANTQCNCNEQEDEEEDKSSVESAEEALPDSPTYPCLVSPSDGNSNDFMLNPPLWLPDEVCSNCMACDIPFTVLRRRHHCRNCGKIFCSRCSSNSVPLPQFGHTKPVRVCNQCFMFQFTNLVMIQHS